SRNRALGVAVARGTTFEQYRAEHRSVAEGANASRAGAALGARAGVELPITAQVGGVLFRGKPARESVAELMGRELISEQWRWRLGGLWKSSTRSARSVGSRASSRMSCGT